VNTAKDQARQKRGKEPHDPDAKWVPSINGNSRQRTARKKNKQNILRVQSARQHECGKWFDHQSGDQFREAYDGHFFCSLVDQDLVQQLPVETYAGDKGYDDSEIIIIWS